MANKKLTSALLCIASVLMSTVLLTSCSPASKSSSDVGTHKRTLDSQTPKVKHQVALTIDDLPSAGARSQSQKRYITELLIKKLVAADVPAIGFVNEKKLGKSEPKPHNIVLLQAWVDA